MDYRGHPSVTKYVFTGVSLDDGPRLVSYRRYLYV